MKNKIVLCFGLMTLMFSAVKAQNTEFGIHAGGALASYKISQQNVSVSSDSRFGFTGGVTAAIHLSPNISFQPELNFTQLGGNFSEGGMTSKLSLSYLQLPLNVVYHMQENQGFFAGAGPSLAYGLSGTQTVSGQGEEESQKVKFGSGDTDDFKPFEIGLNFLAGYRLEQGIVFTFNYNFGLNNVANGTDATYHNRFFGLTVAYMLH